MKLIKEVIVPVRNQPKKVEQDQLNLAFDFSVGVISIMFLMLVFANLITATFFDSGPWLLELLLG